MENDKIRKLMELYHRSTTPEGRAYAEKKILEQGLTLEKIHQMVRMDNPYLEAHRMEGLWNLSTPVHSHGFGEIICCLSNCGLEFLAGKERFLLQRGDIVLVPAGVSHSTLQHGSLDRNFSGYLLWVSGEYGRFLGEQSPHFRFGEDARCTVLRTAGTPWEYICEMFRGITQEAEFRMPGWESAVNGLMTLLMTQVGRAAMDLGQAPQQGNKPELLDVILAYVDSALGEKITLENTASRFWVSQSTITHLFHEKMGISFYKYVTQRRLAEAKNLIREGMPMEKVATRVGFGDYSAFYRAFKQEFGISPRDFRTLNLKHSE